MERARGRVPFQGVVVRKTRANFSFLESDRAKCSSATKEHKSPDTGVRSQAVARAGSCAHGLRIYSGKAENVEVELGSVVQALFKEVREMLHMNIVDFCCVIFNSFFKLKRESFVARVPWERSCR